MANYANLKTAIQQYIKQNGNEEITGAILQTTLLSMVDSLASGYLFKGIARPLFAPATTDGPTFYIALEAGSYINFTLTELGATAILREGYFGIFKTSGGSSNWTFTEVAISIKDGIVTTTKIANGAVTTEKIANGSITNDKILDNAVSTQKIAPNAVTYNKIADDAVGTDKIADEAITTNKIADEAITSEKIAEHTIRWENMGQGAVDEDILQDNSVSESKIKDDAVTEYKLGTHSVSTRSIKDGAVTTNKLYNGAVTTGKLANKTVTKGKLGDDVVAILDEVDNKANIDGSYESMSVGMAKNIEAERATDNTFLFRKTGGNQSVASGVARVQQIKGNSVAWNQLVGTNTTYVSFITNHKYYTLISGEKSIVTGGGDVVGVFVTGGTDMVIDLSIIFGLDNEPTSVEQFEQWLATNIGKQDYYAYNAGELLSAKMLGMKTVGFNQWDEQWEVGGLTQDMPNNRIRSKNYIPVIPSITLYITTNANVAQYNADKELIGYGSNGSSSVSTYLTGEFIINSQAKYIKFNTAGAYGNTYKNDICINLHYTNGRDGEYEPYEEHNYDFDTSKVYGKLNGEGELVQIFPDGMKSAGSIRDELAIMSDIAIKRVGSVDLGTLAWWFSPAIYNTFNSSVSNIKVPANSNITPKIKCARYTTYSINDLDSHSQPSISVYTVDGSVIVKDSAYSDAATFKTAMNGVMLYYELAEPAEYTDLVYRDNGVDKSLQELNIIVDGDGTEEVEVTSPANGNPTSVAPTLDILYGLDAANFIINAPKNYISVESMDAFTSALGAAIGYTITKTWDSSNNRWNFTFTQNRNIEVEQPEESR